MQIWYTADLIVPDGGDTWVYGDPCEPGQGAHIEMGWIDLDWSGWEVRENREDVRPDQWEPGDGPMIDWAVERIMERVGCIDSFGMVPCTAYAIESDQDYRTGIDRRVAAHVDAPPAVAAAIEARLAHETHRATGHRP